ncbi:hypothetical protein [Epibacterium sp. Ofav1-8]|uniref:hypothetical protein n=1 Tax=Epibacterium sp. Ofav1-8 TaxID=2917735 RepID=UPI001EF69382|nr:hypothetical protein [Epibacterium sp. Ofav1-8]MCG7622288.1 hypothetical protein [Epibacterium sp. Ofav1-8]
MDFNIIAPMPVSEVELIASNIPEDDHPDWDSAATYDQGARVISTLSHRIYESLVDNNQGHDPLGDDGSHWLEISATNRWRAFDQRRSNTAKQADRITYSVVPTQDCDAIALFGLTAGTVRIEVWDGAARIYDRSFAMADTGHVVSAYTWFFGGVVYARQKVLNGFPGYIGHRIDITIDATGAVAEVGHIVMGRNNLLGRVRNRPTVQFVSHSRKGYDDFGNEILVKRGSTRKVDLSLLVPTHQAQRVMDIVAEVDGLATAFYVSGDAPSFGIEGLGFVDDHSQPIDVAGESVFPLILKTLK